MSARDEFPRLANAERNWLNGPDPDRAEQYTKALDRIDALTREADRAIADADHWSQVAHMLEQERDALEAEIKTARDLLTPEDRPGCPDCGVGAGAHLKDCVRLARRPAVCEENQ